MNFVDKYVKFAEPLTESPKIMHYYMAYMLLSTAIGRKMWYSGHGSMPVSPNLWMIFIGPSSMTKKTTMLNIGIRHILEVAFANTLAKTDSGEPIQVPVKYQIDGSRENFLESMSANSHGIICHSEFANLMSWMSREYNTGLVGIMTDLYDQPREYSRKVGTGPKARTYVIEKPYINIAACTTLDWLNSSIKENSVTSGFLPRFCIVNAPMGDRSIPRTPPMDKKLAAELAMTLEDIAKLAPREMDYTTSAGLVYDKFYDELKEKARKVGEPMCSFYSRRSVDCTKIAMLNAAMRISETPGMEDRITDEDIKLAVGTMRQICEYTEQIITSKLTYTDFQRNMQKFLGYVEHCGGNNGGAPHSEVLKLMKIKSRDMSELIETAEAEGRIKVIIDRSMPRASTKYQLVEEVEIVHETNNSRVN
jgi:hypothetical protein